MSSRIRYHPLRVYAAIEVIIGCIGIALMLGMSEIGVIYAASAAQGLAGILQRGGYCAALLLPTDHIDGRRTPLPRAAGALHA